MAETCLRLWQEVEQQVHRTPDAVAVIFEDGDSACCVQITYAEMWQRSCQISEELRKHKAEKGVVGVCVVSGENLPSALIGIMQTGSAYFPFGLDGAGFVHQALRKLGVKHLLIDSDSFERLMSQLEKLDCRVIPSATLQSFGLLLIRVCLRSDGGESLENIVDLAYCITTSGTTGAPKVIRVPHACIVSNVADFRKAFKPEVGDVTFLTSPLTFDPSVIDIFMTLTSGASLLMVPEALKMSPERLLPVLCTRYKVSILQITPSLFRRFDPSGVRSTLLAADSRLKVLAFGGETFPDTGYLEQCLAPENRTAVYNLYGITELSCWATLQLVRPPQGMFPKTVPVGSALTGTKVKVADTEGQDVSCGVGQIWLGGSDRICLLDDEDASVLEQGGVWRNTGDRGEIDDQGNIFCLGRDDRQIKRNGKRMDLETLEKVSQKVENVTSSKAIVSEGKLYLFLQSAMVGEKEQNNLCDSVKSQLRFMLPSQYVPDCISVVGQFPVTAHGKLDLSSLLAMHRRKAEIQQSVLPVQPWLSAVWMETAGNYRESPPAPDDQFLAVGGDSLMAVQFVEKVEKVVGCSFTDLLDTVLTRTWHEVLRSVEEKVAHLYSGDAYVEDADGKHLPRLEDSTRKDLSYTSHNSQHAMKGEDASFDILDRRDLPHASQSSQNANTSEQGTSFDIIDRKDVLNVSYNSQNTHSVKDDSHEVEPYRSASKSLSAFDDIDNVSSMDNTGDVLQEGTPVADIICKNVSSLFEGDNNVSSARKRKMDTQSMIYAADVEPEFSLIKKKKIDAEDSVKELNKTSALQKEAVFERPHQQNETVVTELQQRNSHIDAELQQRNSHIDAELQQRNSHIDAELQQRNSHIDADLQAYVSSVGRANTALHTNHEICHCVAHSNSRNCSKGMGSVCKARSSHRTLTACNNGSPSFKFHSDDKTLTSCSSGLPRESTQRLDRERMVQLTPQWAVNTGKCVDASPLLALTRSRRKTAFIGSHSHKFFAIDAERGSVLWVTELGGRIEGSACLSPCGEKVVVGCYDGKIYILNAGTGEVEWTVTTDDMVKCTPVADLSSQLVFCGSHDGFLYALHCKSQRVVWKSHCGGGGVFASPIISPDGSCVFTATLGGQVTAFSLANGEKMWRVSVGKPIFSSPAVDGSHLYVCSVDSTVHCFSVNCGQQEWTFKAAAPIFSSPVVVNQGRSTEQYILFGCHDKHLYCLSDTGNLIWKTETTSTVYASPFSFCLGNTGTCSDSCKLDHCDVLLKTGENSKRDHVSIFDEEERNGEQTCSSCESLKKCDGTENQERVCVNDCVFPSLPVSSSLSSSTLVSTSLSLSSQALPSSSLSSQSPPLSSSLSPYPPQPSVCFCTQNKSVDWGRRTGGKPNNAGDSNSRKLEAGKSRVGSKPNEARDYTSINSEDKKSTAACFSNPAASKVAPETGIEGGRHDSERVVSEFSGIGNDDSKPDCESSASQHCCQCNCRHVYGCFVASASTNGTVSVLCSKTGNVLGSADLPGEVFSSPVVVGDHLVVGCRDDSVYCYKISVSL